MKYLLFLFSTILCQICLAQNNSPDSLVVGSSPEEFPKLMVGAGVGLNINSYENTMFGYNASVDLQIPKVGMISLAGYRPVVSDPVQTNMGITTPEFSTSPIGLSAVIQYFFVDNTRKNLVPVHLFSSSTGFGTVDHVALIHGKSRRIWAARTGINYLRHPINAEFLDQDQLISDNGAILSNNPDYASVVRSATLVIGIGNTGIDNTVLRFRNSRKQLYYKSNRTFSSIYLDVLINVANSVDSLVVTEDDFSSSPPLFAGSYNVLHDNEGGISFKKVGFRLGWQQTRFMAVQNLGYTFKMELGVNPRMKNYNASDLPGAITLSTGIELLFGFPKTKIR